MSFTRLEPALLSIVQVSMHGAVLTQQNLLVHSLEDQVVVIGTSVIAPQVSKTENNTYIYAKYFENYRPVLHCSNKDHDNLSSFTSLNDFLAISTVLPTGPTTAPAPTTTSTTITSTTATVTIISCLKLGMC